VLLYRAGSRLIGLFPISWLTDILPCNCVVALFSDWLANLLVRLRCRLADRWTATLPVSMTLSLPVAHSSTTRTASFSSPT
jgi:hypothetical protein